MSCANSSEKRPAPSDPKRRLKRWAMGLYRVAIIVSAMACLFLGKKNPTGGSPVLLLAESKKILPVASSVGDPKNGFFPVSDSAGDLLAWATTTNPQAGKIQGYSGPSELFVLLSPARKVLAVHFLKSSDTSGHVAEVREDLDFWKQWDGKSEAELGILRKSIIVSGATLTSDAMARGLAARFGAAGLDAMFPKALTLSDVKKWYPKVEKIISNNGVSNVMEGGKKIGTVLRSSRIGVLERGYNGPSDVLVALSEDEETILGIAMPASRDNEPYVGYVQDEIRYADGFAGKPVDLVIDPEEPPLIVSGASMTTYAVNITVRDTLKSYFLSEPPTKFPWKAALAILWIALGVISVFSKTASKPKWRLAFAAVSVAAGLSLGWMISQDQLIGWGSHGLSKGLAVPLLVLTAVALLVPAFTGKNVYCSRLCPHGAAQTLLGNLLKRRFALHGKLHLLFSKIPWLTLTVIWLLAFLGFALPFANAEPFEIWSSGFHSILPAAILTIGLIASVFLPQAYCHYGCPTGALLKFLTHSPSAWTRRDTAASILVTAAFLWTLR